MTATEARQIAARSAQTQQLDAVLASAAASMLPASRDVEFDCPVHGKMTYTTYQLKDGTWKAPYCPKCRKLELEKQARIEEASTRERERCAELRKMLGLGRPSDFEGKTLETYHPENPEEEKNLMVATRFAKRFSIREAERETAHDAQQEGWREINAKGLIFIGNPGTGKSHLAYAILHELDAQGIPGCYVTVPSLLEVMTNRYAQVDRIAAMAKLCMVSCLVLDEVGVQKGNHDELKVLYQIIDGRIKNGRPTIFITNLDKAELEELLTERIMSRVRNAGYALTFKTGRDRRVSANRTNDPTKLF